MAVSIYAPNSTALLASAAYGQNNSRTRNNIPGPMPIRCPLINLNKNLVVLKLKNF